jgi:CBS domain-containing protein
MTASPPTIRSGTPLRDAVALIEARRLSELPVIHETGLPPFNSTTSRKRIWETSDGSWTSRPLLRPNPPFFTD